MKIYDALAERYGIDRDTIKQAFHMYNYLGNLPHSDRVRRVRAFIHDQGYTGYRWSDLVDNMFKHRD